MRFEFIERKTRFITDYLSSIFTRFWRKSRLVCAAKCNIAVAKYEENVSRTKSPLPHAYPSKYA